MINKCLKVLALLLLSAKIVATELDLYYTPRCPHSQKVLSYLKKQHKSVPLKDVSANPSYKQQLKEIGGRLEVPCLVVDGYPVYGEEPIIGWMKTHPTWLTDEPSF